MSGAAAKVQDGSANLAQSLRKAAGRRLRAEAAFSPETISVLGDQMPDALREAVETMSTHEIDELLAMSERALLSPKLFGRTFMGHLAKLVQKARIKGIRKRIRVEIDLFGVPAVFEPGFEHYADQAMQRYYAAYVSRQQKVALGQGKRAKIRDALAWALEPEAKGALAWAIETEARGATNRLRLLLGDNYRGELRELSKSDLITELSRAEAIRFADFNKMGPMSYDEWRSLRDADRLTPGHSIGQYAEGDHVFEQRVPKNDPRGDYITDAPSQGVTMIVAKNSHTAALLRGHGVETPYVHSIKSRVLRDLIPNHLIPHFSPQQIWDAHIEALRRAGLNKFPDQLLADLQDEFELYVAAIRDGGQSVPDIIFRTKAPEGLFHPATWTPEWLPRVLR